MKNNTKLIMETWRRYLKEGPDGTEPQENEAGFEDDVPVENDPDMTDDMPDMTDGMDDFDVYNPMKDPAPMLNDPGDDDDYDYDSSDTSMGTWSQQTGQSTGSYEEYLAQRDKLAAERAANQNTYNSDDSDDDIDFDWSDDSFDSDDEY